ncbi:NHL repeat-containing protein [Cupriavidus agavae]|uniref:NHL repeat-containing protein n=2 Tax=Cupriavidus agavae TaxID=1001822 RepID=A0A4Q7RZC9_9BURK|nr:NHL repeat-containing protein [Cupriavidus agavae]
MEANSRLKQHTRALTLVLGIAVLSGCGGGDNPSASTPAPQTDTTPVVPVVPAVPVPVTYTVGGTLSGLAAAASVVLQNNGVDALTLSANGAFKFSTAVTDLYAVTVGTQPTGQTCTVTHGSGTAAADVTDVSVDCVNNPPAAAQVSTLAGSGIMGYLDATGTAARFSQPAGMAVDALGNVFVADNANHRVRKITPSGVVTTIAGSGPGSVDATGTAASFRYLSGLAIDAAGNLYVADQMNHQIRKIDTSLAVTTFAGSTTFGSADGTGAAAGFREPFAICIDTAGNLYVADSANNMIRKITPAGVVTTVAGTTLYGHADGTGAAASFYTPSGIAVDSAGNVYVADMNNHMIRKITPAGVVTTLAGSTTLGRADGTGTAAQFYLPQGIAVDSDNNVYVSEKGNSTIRKITPAGVVTTIAGGLSNGSVDGDGPSATFWSPWSLAIDSARNLYAAELGNNIIRKIVLP